MCFGTIYRWEGKEEVIALRHWPVLHEPVDRQNIGMASVIILLTPMCNLSYTLLLPTKGTWHVLGSLCVRPGPHVALHPCWSMAAGFSVSWCPRRHGFGKGFCVATVHPLLEQFSVSCSLAFSLGGWRTCLRGEQPCPPRLNSHG